MDSRSRLLNFYVWTNFQLYCFWLRESKIYSSGFCRFHNAFISLDEYLAIRLTELNLIIMSINSTLHMVLLFLLKYHLVLQLDILKPMISFHLLFRKTFAFRYWNFVHSHQLMSEKLYFRYLTPLNNK